LSLTKCATPYCGGQYLYELTWDSKGCIDEGPECNLCNRKDPRWLAEHPPLNLEYDELDPGEEPWKDETPPEPVIVPGRTCRKGLHPWIEGQKQCRLCLRIAQQRRDKRQLERERAGRTNSTVNKYADEENALSSLFRELQDTVRLSDLRASYEGQNGMTVKILLGETPKGALIYTTQREITPRRGRK
jgi:hypothetical protein